MFGVILKVFILQVIFAIIIVVILKKALDKMLIESAIKKLKVLRWEGTEKIPAKVTVISHHPLKEGDIQNIQKALYRKFHKTIPVLKEIQKSIKGGVIIRINGLNIDHSLASRLKESGMFR